MRCSTCGKDSETDGCEVYARRFNVPAKEDMIDDVFDLSNEIEVRFGAKNDFVVVTIVDKINYDQVRRVPLDYDEAKKLRDLLNKYFKGDDGETT